jgi:hypothetical protein
MAAATSGRVSVINVVGKLSVSGSMDVGVGGRLFDHLLGFYLVGHRQHLQRVFPLRFAAIGKGCDHCDHDAYRGYQAYAGQHQDPSSLVGRSFFDPLQIAHCSVHFSSRSSPPPGFTKLPRKQPKNSSSEALRVRAGGVRTW